MSAPTKRSESRPTRMQAIRRQGTVRPSPCDPELTTHCPAELLAGLLATERAQPSCATTAAYEQTRLDLDLAARVAVDAFRVQATPRPLRPSRQIQRPAVSASKHALPLADAPTVVTAKGARAPRAPATATALRGKPRRKTKLVTVVVLGAAACSLAILGCIMWTFLPHTGAPRGAAVTPTTTPTANRTRVVAAGTADAAAQAAPPRAPAYPPPLTAGPSLPPAAATTQPPTPAQAADSLAHGDLAQAARAYQALARTRQANLVFGFIARALQRRVAAQCAQRTAVGGEPCDAS